MKIKGKIIKCKFCLDINATKKLFLPLPEGISASVFMA